MAIQSSILAWEMPWTEEPGGLQVMGLAGSDMTQLTHTIVQKKPIQHCKTIIL